MELFDLIIIGIYFVIMLVVGLMFSRSGNSTKNFFAGGGNVPWWISGLSLYMSFFSSGVFVVWGSIAYQQGLVAITIQWTMCIASFIVAFFIAPRWNRLSILTAAEYIGSRFGSFLQKAYAVSFMVVGVVIAGSVLYPVSRLLQESLGVPFQTVVIVLGLVVILYTTLGGLWAVLVTDVLQFVILTATVLFTAVLALNEVGGISQFFAKLPDSHLSFSGGEYTNLFMFTFILVHIVKIGGDWTYIQRFTSVPSPSDAKKAVLLFSGLYLVSPIVWMLPPMVYFILEPNLDRHGAETAYILICQKVLPVGMLGMMLASMISATASTANTILNMSAAVFTNDIYKKFINPISSEKKLMVIARSSTVFFGMLMILIALSVPNMGGVVSLILSINALTYVPLLAPPVWALFSPYITWKGAFTSIVVGLGVNLFFKFISPIWFDLSLNRTEEAMVGLVITPMILLLFELYQRYIIKTKISKHSDMGTPTKRKQVEPESIEQNQFGISIVAYTVIAAGFSFVLIALFTSQYHRAIFMMGVLISALGFMLLIYKINSSKKTISKQYSHEKY